MSSSLHWAMRRCATRAAWRGTCDAPAFRWKWLAGGKLKRAMELANKIGARYALILGDDEIAAGQYSLKDMQSGEQQRVTRDELFQRIGNKN